MQQYDIWAEGFDNQGTNAPALLLVTVEVSSLTTFRQACKLALTHLEHYNLILILFGDVSYLTMRPMLVRASDNTMGKIKEHFHDEIERLYDEDPYRDLAESVISFQLVSEAIKDSLVKDFRESAEVVLRKYGHDLPMSSPANGWGGCFTPLPDHITYQDIKDYLDGSDK